MRSEAELYDWFEARGVPKAEVKDNPTATCDRTPLGFVIMWVWNGFMHSALISLEDADGLMEMLVVD